MTQKKVNKIKLDELKRDPSSYIDPQGFVFHYHNAIYRYLYPESAPLFQKLIEEGLLHKLEKQFNLVSTKISNLEILEHSHATILEHEKIWPLSYAVEWGPSMLYHAAKLTLEIAIALTDNNLMLQDAHPWNVLYKGTMPVFVDLTSITQMDKKTLWPAHEQCEAFFLRPLIVSNQGKGFCARSMLYDYNHGIALGDFIRLLSVSYKISHPALMISLWLDKKLQSNTKIKERVRTLSENSMKNVTPNIRKKFLQKMLKKLGNPPTVKKNDPWHDYYSEIDDAFDKEYKIKTVRHLMQTISPETVLDIGCNRGVFSIEAAKIGARVIALDSSEACIEQLYQTARNLSLHITPLIADITSPTPAFGYMSEQYPSLIERAKSDCVLFLGIMHHIHISGRQSFERIAQLLNKLADKYLIFEFVSMQDANIPHLSKRRDIDYNEDNVREILAQYFKKIEIHQSDRETRRLFLCIK